MIIIKNDHGSEIHVVAYSRASNGKVSTCRHNSDVDIKVKANSRYSHLGIFVLRMSEIVLEFSLICLLIVCIRKKNEIEKCSVHSILSHSKRRTGPKANGERRKTGRLAMKYLIRN